MHSASEVYFQATKRVIRYIENTLELEYSRMLLLFPSIDKQK